MPSPKRRMGAFNALNDLPSVEDVPLTEPEAPLWPWLESRTPPPPHPVAMHRMNPRPRRIGGFNALDDLLPGPQGGQAETAETAETAGRQSASPSDGGWVGDPAGQALPQVPPQASAGTVPRGGERSARERRAAAREVGFNALDDLLPGPGGYGGRYAPGSRAGEAVAYQPAARQEKVRMTFLLPNDLVEAAADAAAFLSGPPARLTLRTLAEQALRNEIDRLADVYHGGMAFPARRRR
jgi:hypothetical protein